MPIGWWRVPGPPAARCSPRRGKHRHDLCRARRRRSRSRGWSGGRPESLHRRLAPECHSSAPATTTECPRRAARCPGCRRIAGHDHPHGATVDPRKRFGVHLPGQQHFLRHGLAQRDRAAVGLDRGRLLRDVRGTEGDVQALVKVDSGCAEDVCQPDSTPFGGRDRPVGPRVLAGYRAPSAVQGAGCRQRPGSPPRSAA